MAGLDVLSDNLDLSFAGCNRCISIYLCVDSATVSIKKSFFRSLSNGFFKRCSTSQQPYGMLMGKFGMVIIFCFIISNLMLGFFYYY